MAKAKTTTISYTLIVLATILAAALPRLTAQSQGLAPMLPPVSPGPAGMMAPSPGPDCFTYLLNLSDCLTFVTVGSNLTKPDRGCCPELANLVNTQPVCLCELLGNPGQTGITVDVNRALKLPSVCSVDTPSASLCAAIGIPVGALAPSEAPSGGSIATSPSPGNGDDRSSGNLLASSHHYYLIGLAALLFTYFI